VGRRIEGLVTEDDLKQLIGSLGVGARDPEREGWDHVVAKENDAVSYRAWCDKTAVRLRSVSWLSLYRRLVNLSTLCAARNTQLWFLFCFYSIIT
jgi:hypothetical protein